jgi:hypothetical protein
VDAGGARGRGAHTVALALLVGVVIAVLAPADAAAARRKPRRHATPAGAGTDDDGRASDGSPRDRVVVLPFRGPGSGGARAATMEALGVAPAVELVPLRRLGPRYANPRSKAPLGAAVLERLRLAALVRGHLKKTGRGVRATLAILDGKSGATEEELTFQGRNARAVNESLTMELMAKLGPVLDRLAGRNGEGKGKETPAADGKAGADGHAHAHADADADGKSGGAGAPAPPLPVPSPGATTPEPAPHACPTLDVDLAGGVMVRWFDYRDEQRGALRGYMLTRAPVGRAAATVYPFGRRSCSRASAVGLRLGAERMLLATSTLAGRQLATDGSAYQALLVARLPAGPLMLRPSAGLVLRRYTVAGDVVPNVDYLMLGAGVEASLKIRFAVVELGGAVRWVLGSGDIASATWFPGATATEYAAVARAGVALNHRYDLLVSADVEYLSFDFHIKPTGPYPNGVASGAYDIYAQYLLALRIHLF